MRIGVQLGTWGILTPGPRLDRHEPRRGAGLRTAPSTLDMMVCMGRHLMLFGAALLAAFTSIEGLAGQGRGGRGSAVQIKPGDECPPGTTLVRVGQCQAPEVPPPSIVDYRPKSLLVVEEHKVPRAKFPVVDIHSHTGPTAQTIDQLIKEMDALN